MLGRLLEVIVLLLVIRAVWRVVGNMITVSAGARRTTASGEPRAVKLVRDPVCGTYVVPANAVTSGAGAQMKFFCSENCRRAYAMKIAQ